jgi:hypothetical protein
MFVPIILLCAWAPADGGDIIVDFGDEQIKITDEILQGGWFNYDTKREHTENKTLCERAADIVEKIAPAAIIPKHFPDVVMFLDPEINKREIKPHDGSVVFHPHREQRFNVMGQLSGKRVDREKLYGDIWSALRGGNPSIIKVNYLSVPPTPKEQIIKKIVRRGEFSTHFMDNPPREHNIALSVAKFDGLAVAAGAEVSFNKVVGARTAARGYQEAKIILDGEYVEGIGGGVCQSSTTLFNAVVQAGLHITESHNHTLKSHYVPLGWDAMVSSGYDLRFVNNSGSTIYFETSVADNRVYVTIYGKTKGENIHYKLSTQTTKEYPPKEELDDKVEIPENILKDYKIHPEFFNKEITQDGEPGYSVITYIEVYKGERLLNKKVLRRSTYRAQPTKYRIVAKPMPLDLIFRPSARYN